MTINEIRKKFQNEWVLIVRPRVSKQTRIAGGDVAVHSKDRAEIRRQMSKIVGDKAIVYTGNIPEDVEVLLSNYLCKFDFTVEYSSGTVHLRSI